MIPAVSIRNLKKSYGNTVALKGVNISIGDGEFFGLLGPNGAGKTTTINILTGLVRKNEGEAKIFGKDTIADYRYTRAQVGISSQEFTQDWFFPLDRLLYFQAGYYGIPKAQAKNRIDELLELVELPTSYKTRLPGELSGGEKQRINLARALAAEPEVILCDEVTSALDTVVGKAVIDLLKKLQANLGVAYLFISHDLSTVASFADHVVVLYAGRVVEQGPLASVLAPPFHPYTRLLLNSVPELRTDWLDGVVASKAHLDHLGQAVDSSKVGCPFFNRCAVAVNDVCNRRDVPLRQMAQGHTVACHLELDALRG